MGVSSTQVRDIFLCALEAEAPGEYLDEACGDNVQLRSRVEQLLMSHQQAGDFLTLPSLSRESVELRPALEGPGTVIGRYKLLQEIGEGGFGMVYMADQQEPVTRKVALKIIKLGMDTRQVVARFEAERQLMAMMDHPCIAKVLDAGSTESGRPYFVMELVDGQSITTYCDEHRMGIRERLQLFAAICDAVDHAHSRGVIHRDIKPSNVLVTGSNGDPTPKVIDFGVAKATQRSLDDETFVTRTGQFIGTPQYMSPEQADMSPLDIGPRSDVYSLGVLLYELLTGTTPLDADQLLASGLDQMRRIMREAQPLRPSARLTSLGDTVVEVASRRDTQPATLNRTVAGDLDWITLKALEEDPRSRYATASELAEDVRNFLESKPIHARRPALTHRLAIWSRRHQAIVWSAAVTLLVAVVALSVSVLLIVRAYDRATANLETLRHLTVSILGPIDEQRGDFDTTIVTWNKIIELNPESAICWQGRGLVYGEFGHKDKAINDMTEAIQRNPKAAFPYACRGWYRLEKGELDESIRDYTESVRLDPRFPGAYAGRGYAHCLKGQLSLAQADCDKAIQIAPKWSVPYCFRSLVRARLGQIDRARQDLDESSRLEPQQLVDVYLTAWFLVTCPDRRLHRPQRAAKLVEHALASRPRAEGLWMLLGASWYRQGDFPEAVRALEKSLNSAMSEDFKACAWLFLAMTHWQRGSAEQAHHWYEKAAEWIDVNGAKHGVLAYLRKEADELFSASQTSTSGKENHTEEPSRAGRLWTNRPGTGCKRSRARYNRRSADRQRSEKPRANRAPRSKQRIRTELSRRREDGPVSPSCQQRCSPATRSADALFARLRSPCSHHNTGRIEMGRIVMCHDKKNGLWTALQARQRFVASEWNVSTYWLLEVVASPTYSIPLTPAAVFIVLAVVALPVESTAAAPVRMGAIGDALTDEYTTSEPPSGKNWVDIVATRRENEIDFGSRGSWGEPRRRGYEFNWARYGATSTDMVRKDLHTGLSSQAVDFAYIGIGGNDFSPWAGSYSSIYNGRRDGSQTMDRLLENINVALDEVAGTPDNPTGVKVIIGNIGGMGAIPYVVSNHPDAEKRALVAAAETETNNRIAKIAAERGMPVVDVFGLMNLTSGDSPPTVGDVTMRRGSSSNGQYLYLDYAHPGTVWQGLLANATMEAANQTYAADFTRLSDQEILEIAGVNDPNGGSVTSYFPAEDFVILPPALQAGDADQDLDFDQLDLIQVQQTAKYLTGERATWGEGDWNGAPGGSMNNPPSGDGKFDQVDVIAALSANVYLKGPYAAIDAKMNEAGGQSSIVYNSTTGELRVDAPASTELTSINIDSAAGIFTGDAAENLGGSFDNHSDDNIFKATFGTSFGALSFGDVAQAGLSEDFLDNDLTMVGSLAAGGDLGEVDLIYVPEPSSLLLALLAMFGLPCLRRR